MILKPLSGPVERAAHGLSSLSPPKSTPEDDVPTSPQKSTSEGDMPPLPEFAGRHSTPIADLLARTEESKKIQKQDTN